MGVCSSLLFVVIVCLSWGDDRHCCEIVSVVCRDCLSELRRWSALLWLFVCLSWDDRHCCEIVVVGVFSMLFVLLAAWVLVLIINGGWAFPRSPSCCGHVSHCCCSLCFSLELSCFYRLLIFWSSIKLPMICRLTTRYNLTVPETFSKQNVH